jgi:hypothetical protein
MRRILVGWIAAVILVMVGVIGRGGGGWVGRLVMCGYGRGGGIAGGCAAGRAVGGVDLRCGGGVDGGGGVDLAGGGVLVRRALA